MARLFADENFRHPVVVILRSLGHDVLTIQEAGLANRRFPDTAVLAEAAILDRVVLTHDRDFIRLHNSSNNHAGIVFCTRDRNSQALAERIHVAISTATSMNGQLLRVYRPSKP